MKYFLIIALLIMVGSRVNAQENYQDVVYLKNGSIIRGMIVEQVPNKSIKIETYDKSLFVFQIDEIEKITKEPSAIVQNNGKSQQKRRGYIGLSLGSSIPVGAFADPDNGTAKAGLQINLVNFGYLFTKNIGICAIWYGAANPVSAEIFKPYAYGGILAGPLLSFPIGPVAELDFRPMIGYSATTVAAYRDAEDKATAFAYNLGTVLRFNFSRKFSLTFNADYFSTNPHFGIYGFDQNIGTISLGAGIAYRLK